MPRDAPGWFAAKCVRRGTAAIGLPQGGVPGPPHKQARAHGVGRGMRVVAWGGRLAVQALKGRTRWHEAGTSHEAVQTRRSGGPRVRRTTADPHRNLAALDRRRPVAVDIGGAKCCRAELARRRRQAPSGCTKALSAQRFAGSVPSFFVRGRGGWERSSPARTCPPVAAHPCLATRGDCGYTLPLFCQGRGIQGA